MDAYHREVARGLRGAALTADLIILAQASMHGAIAHCPEITDTYLEQPGNRISRRAGAHRL